MHIEKSLFLWLCLAFIFATVVGTLTHEVGHYLTAERLGYDAVIHYGSTSIIGLKPGHEGNTSDPFWITLGGSAQTILTGSLGALCLFLFRKSFQNKERLRIWQWVVIFISLFWLRQPANFVIWVGGYIMKGRFSPDGDEIKLSRHLAMPDCTLLCTTALIGIVLLVIICFRYVPAKQRATFLLAGATGGLSGYLLWFEILGKIVLP
jgi:hypothetical protein